MNPIRKVLSTMRAREVKCLLMGGQACVLYGAAEFSRDTDLAILAEPSNLERLSAALDDLKAEQIAFPALSLDVLLRGHAIHFRCHHRDAEGQRVDVMSVMRGVAPFPDLWERRTTLRQPDGESWDLLSLPDLVLAKKTQRDKDWPMLRRLLESHYAKARGEGTSAEIAFWLTELRTPELLIEVCRRYPAEAAGAQTARAAVAAAIIEDERATAAAIADEEAEEREQDRVYWRPLKDELERLRRERPR